MGPLTEARVTIRDVRWFLLSAGWRGTVAGFRGFRRLMFGSWVPLKTAGFTGLLVLFALAVVLSLVLLNSTLALIVAGNALKGGQGPAFPNPMLVASVLDNLATLEGRPAARPSRRRRALVEELVSTPQPFHESPMAPADVARVAARRLGLGRAHCDGVGRNAVSADLIRYRGAPADGRTTAWLFMLVAGIAFAISYVVRFFLIQYLGDVVIYVSAYAVSKFQEVRVRV